MWLAYPRLLCFCWQQMKILVRFGTNRFEFQISKKNSELFFGQPPVGRTQECVYFFHHHMSATIFNKIDRCSWQNCKPVVSRPRVAFPFKIEQLARPNSPMLWSMLILSSHCFPGFSFRNFQSWQGFQKLIYWIGMWKPWRVQKVWRWACISGSKRIWLRNHIALSWRTHCQVIAFLPTSLKLVLLSNKFPDKLD